MNTHVCILHAVGFWLSTFLLGLSKYLRTPISKTKLHHSESMHYISAHCKDEIVNVSSFLFFSCTEGMLRILCNAATADPKLCHCFLFDSSDTWKYLFLTRTVVKFPGTLQLV